MDREDTIPDINPELIELIDKILLDCYESPYLELSTSESVLARKGVIEQLTQAMDNYNSEDRKKIKDLH